MANNNSYDKFLAVNKLKLKNVEAGLECAINFDGEVVSKILAVDIQGNVSSVEALSGEASVSGNILVNLVYLTEQGLVGSACYSSTFANKFIDNHISPSTKVFAKVVSCDAQVKSLNMNIAKVECLVVLSGYAYNNEEVNYLTGVDENVCMCEEQLKYQTLDTTTNNNFVENVEMEIKDPVTKIISTTCDCFVKNIEAADGFVSAEAELCTKVLYLTNEENPELKTTYTKTNLKQEFECENSSKDKLLELDMVVNKTNIKNTISEDGKINVEIPLDTTIRIFSQNEVYVITDMFSTKTYTLATTSSFENSCVCEPITFEKKIEGSLTLSEEEPRIDKLLAVNYSKVVITNEYVDNGVYTLSGVITTNLIYFNEDDNLINSVDAQVPFVISSKTECKNENQLDFNVCLQDVDVLVKKGRDIYIDATVKVRTHVSEQNVGVVTTELEYKEDLPTRDYAIEIYFAKSGEKVWDIAKRLNVKPEYIYEQNPDTPEILEKDEQLAIYYNKNSK